MKRKKEIMCEAKKIWENMPSRFDTQEIKAIGYCLVRIATKIINEERLKRIRKGDEMQVEKIK
ncbi:hypothetical protein ES705_09376 [subsurface metagenome]